MHLWLNGWDWGWMIITIAWVIALAVGFYVAVQLTNRHTRRLR